MTTQRTSDFIAHALSHQYDPTRAHEYYERTKKLKGRKKGASKPDSSKRPGASHATSRPKRPSTTGAAGKKAQARAEELKGRLAKLEKLLEQLTKQAKARSGVTTKPKKSATKAKAADNQGKRKLSAQEKAAAKKRSAEYRKKNPVKKSASAEVAATEKKIKAVRKQIAAIRKQLQAAVNQARKTAKSNGK